MLSWWPRATLSLLAGCSLIDLDDLDRSTASTTAVTTTASSSTAQVATASVTSTTSSSSSGGGGAGCGALTDCSGACVDLSNNATSCGRCGRYCEGGGCEAGECQPVVIWQGPVDVAMTLRSTGVSLSSDEVVWNANDNVFALPKDAQLGDVPRAITHVRGARVLVDGGSAYLSGSPMVKVDLQTGADQTLYNAPCRHEIALRPPYVFCSDQDMGVRRFALDGTNPSSVQDVTTEYTALVVIGDFVYYQGLARQLLRRPIHLDMNAETIFVGAALRGGLATVNGHVYALGPDALLDIDIAGGTGTAIMETKGAAGMLVADARAIYVTQWGTPYLLRKSLDGGPDLTFTTDARHTDVVVMDDTRVFFTDHTGNALYRLVR